MKKKVLSVLLSLALTAGLSACGGSGSSDADTGSSDATQETASEEEASEEETDSDEADSSGDVSVEEQVLMEWEGLKVTLTGIEINEYSNAPVAEFLVENDTSYGISLEVSALYVNGCYMEDSSYGLKTGDVPAGKKANQTLSLDASGLGVLPKLGIDTVGSFECQFTVRDSSTDYYDDNSILYTSDIAEVRTSEYDSMDTSAISEGTELYNQNGVRIVAKDIASYAQTNYALYLYVENTTDMDIVMDSYDVTVNGFVPEGSGGLNAWSIPAGRYSADGLVIFYDSTVPDEASLGGITDIEFGIKIYDESSWTYGYTDDGLLADTGMMTFTPQS